MITAEAKFYIIIQGDLLEEHHISVRCMTIIHTTSQPTPLLYPAFSIAIALFIDAEKTTVVSEVIVSLMTTGISTEFNILAWEICFAHPKWLSVLNTSAQSDVHYINKTTQTACLSISKKGSTPAILGTYTL